MSVGVSMLSPTFIEATDATSSSGCLFNRTKHSNPSLKIDLELPVVRLDPSIRPYG